MDNSTVSSFATEEDKLSLGRAWTSVLSQYQVKADMNAKDFGPGIAYFQMLKNPKEGAYNCKYCYASRMENEEGPWKSFVMIAPNYEAIIHKYDPNRNYLIAVSVPSSSEDENIVIGIRMFEYDTGREIDLPNKE